MSSGSYDVIVIGEGIAGLTAAGFAARRGRSTAMFEALLFGGLIININEIDGWAGQEARSGVDLVTGRMMENLQFGVEGHEEEVTAIGRDGDRVVVMTGESRYRARSVIVASGARLRRLGIPGEMEFEHRGVSQCADCDAPMLQGADAVVVGGGDSALQEALVLANACARVHLVHRGSRFRARQHLVDAVAGRANIRPVWNTAVEAVLGTDRVTAVRTRSLAEGAIAEIPCGGVFAYVGLEPASAFLPPEIRRDPGGCVITDSTFATSMPGVYAVGAVRAGYGGTVAEAIAEAEAAAAACTIR